MGFCYEVSKLTNKFIKNKDNVLPVLCCGDAQQCQGKVSHVLMSASYFVLPMGKDPLVCSIYVMGHSWSFLDMM
jgi:hypothetical protein